MGNFASLWGSSQSDGGRFYYKYWGRAGAQCTCVKVSLDTCAPGGQWTRTTAVVEPKPREFTGNLDFVDFVDFVDFGIT